MRWLIPGLMFLVLVSVAAAQTCPDGYVWRQRFGTACMQEGCNDIPDAHWDEFGDCVCGSSDEPYPDPDDANKECYRPSNYTDCPDCVYECQPHGTPCSEGGDSTDPDLPDEDPGDGGTIPPPDNGTNPPPEDEGDDTGNETGGETGDETGTSEDTSGDESGAGGGGGEGAGAGGGGGGGGGISCGKICKIMAANDVDVVVTSVEGIFPDCVCKIESASALTRLSMFNGSLNTLTYDPNGNLTSNETFSLEDIRKRLGYAHTGPELDLLLDPAELASWFTNLVSSLKTETRGFHPVFWWQHSMAFFDHGLRASSAFVDRKHYGRMYDSIAWLEDRLKLALELGDKKEEAMLRITVERFGRDYAAILIRPQGIPNQEWADLVSHLNSESAKRFLTQEDLGNRLLNALVFDPYYRQYLTARDFTIGKGFRIS